MFACGGRGAAPAGREGAPFPHSLRMRLPPAQAVMDMQRHGGQGEGWALSAAVRWGTAAMGAKEGDCRVDGAADVAPCPRQHREGGAAR